MYLIYLDESGDPGPYDAKSVEKKSNKTKNGKSQTRFYIISALMIQGEDVQSLEEIVNDVLNYLSGIGVGENLVEIKGSIIWDRIRNKFSNNIESARNVMRNIYDIIKDGKYTVIAIAVDKEAYFAELDKKLTEVRSSLTRVLDDIQKSAYFNVLSLPSIRNKVCPVIDEKFKNLRDSLASSLTKYQAMNELILRITKFLETKDTSAILFFDADANTLKDSVYAYLAAGFRKNGVATRRGVYSEVSRIKCFHLLDSKLTPPLWIADLIAYGIHMVLDYRDKEVYNKLEGLFNKDPDGVIWGYGFKVIPWSEEYIRKHLQI